MCPSEKSRLAPCSFLAFDTSRDLIMTSYVVYRARPAEGIMAFYAIALQRLPAIDDDRLTGDPGRKGRRQEHHHIRHLLRLTEPPERDVAKDGIVELGIFCLAAIPDTAGKLDRARRDTVHPDAVPRIHRRLGVGVVDHRRLDRAVGRLPGRRA